MNSVKKLLGVGLLALAALFAAVPAQAQIATSSKQTFHRLDISQFIVDFDVDGRD